MRSLTWPQVRAWRLAHHHLREGSAAADMPAAVADVGGIQAQVISAAEQAVGIRVPATRRADVREALWQDRTLVKGYGPRGTLHLLPSCELSLWNSAMRADPYWTQQSWRDQFELKPRMVEAFFAAISDALDGACLTREALADEVGQRVGPQLRQHLASTWGEMLRPAGYLGLLIFGPSEGAKVTFVRPDQWLGHQPDIEPEKALTDVVRRYFAGYGPATYRELGRWFGMRPGPARALLSLVADELVEVDVEGQRMSMIATDVDGPWGPADPFRDVPSLRLVGQYEAYLLGCGPKEQVLPESARPRIFAVGRGRFEGAVAHQILLVDGLVAGMWERRQRGSRLEVLVESFGTLDSARRALLDREVAMVGDFFGAEATLRLGQVGAPAANGGKCAAS